jgi:hypothetical protein
MVQVAMRAGNRNVFVDTSRIVSKCKIPNFTQDSIGNPIAVFWDCENRKEIVYSIAEYRKKKAAGEL